MVFLNNRYVTIMQEAKIAALRADAESLQVSCAHLWPLQKRERKLKTLKDTDCCAAIKGGFSIAPPLDPEAWPRCGF